MVLNDVAFGVILFVLLVWVGAVSVWLYKINRHYTRLAGKTDKGTLNAVLDKLLNNQEEVEKHIRKVEEFLEEFRKETRGHVQKVGVIRFNPFPETGGDQSFALSLLNGEDTGFVLLSLHAREGTRTYVKPVLKGKSKYELSKEEQQAIAQAQKS